MIVANNFRIWIRYNIQAIITIEDDNLLNKELGNGAVIAATTRIVAGYVSKNVLPRSELPNVIAKTLIAINNLDQRANGQKEPASQSPAVPIHESIHTDYLVSLEDGRRFRSLRRHLMSSYGLTPAMYRAKWGLPRDYPMVAPSFAAVRSELSKATNSSNRRPESSTRSEDAMDTLSNIDFEMAANLLSAMGNEKRILVLDIISREETSVGRLAVLANITLSSLSQHLTKLRSFNLVQTRRDAQTIYYRSESEEVRKLLATVYEIYDIALPIFRSKRAQF